ncbi:MAG: ribbon-helix-helix domain-containing protein [Candidatus Binataceae bacterium]
MEEAVRWNIKVSKKTDLRLRTFLGAQGMKKGDLSKFIEDAVKWRVFDQTLAEVRAKFSDLSQRELQDLIDEAVREVRTERHAKMKLGKA